MTGFTNAYIHLVEEWDKLCVKYDEQSEELTALRQENERLEGELQEAQARANLYYAENRLEVAANSKLNRELREARGLARKYYRRYSRDIKKIKAALQKNSQR